MLSRCSHIMVLGPLLVFFAVAALLMGCPADKGPTHTVKPDTDAGEVEVDSAVRVIHEFSWNSFDVRLIGVDRDKKRAYVRATTRAPKPRMVIDTIDLRSGEQVDRWEASEQAALEQVGQYPRFRALTGTFGEDLARYADIVRSTGPWVTRARLLSPSVMVQPKGAGVLYDVDPTTNRDGDWLMFLPSPGAKAVRVDEGSIASYNPIFSAAGDWLAFRGCHPKAPGRADCSYFLYTSSLSGAPVRHAKVRNPGPPTFTPDGKVLVMAAGKGGERCLVVQTPSDAKASPTVLKCLAGGSDAAFSQSSDGVRAVVGHLVGDPGSQKLELYAIDLATAEVGDPVEVPGAVGVGVLIDKGRHAVPLQRGGLALVRLGDSSVTIAPKVGGGFQLPGSRWVEGLGLILLRAPERDNYEVIAVDVEHELFGKTAEGKGGGAGSR